MKHPNPAGPHPRSIFHVPTRYALLAMARLPNDGGYCLARNLATELGLPGPFLAKILQDLTHAGLLESHRGPLGGFRLSRPSESISLREIVVAMEGPEPFEDCLLGHQSGPEGCNCPIRPAWDQLNALLTTALSETSLRDLQTSPSPGAAPEDPDPTTAAPI